MSDVVFRCPGCEKNLCAGDDSVGMTLQCPDCENQITVPAPDLSFTCSSCGAEVRAPSALAGEVFDCALCGKSFTIPVPAKPDTPSVGGKQVEITCPSCSVVLEIESDALKEMAGKSLDCPECNAKIPVPATTHKKLSVAASGVLVSASSGARSASSCPECHAGLAKDAVLCTSCGFDLRTGKKLSAESGETGKLAVKSEEPKTGSNELNPMLSRYALPQEKEKKQIEKLMPYLKIGGGILALAVIGLGGWYFADDLKGLLGGKKPAKMAAPAKKPGGPAKSSALATGTSTNRPGTNVMANTALKAGTNLVVVLPVLKITGSIIASVETLQKIPGEASAMQDLLKDIQGLVESNDTRAIKAGIMTVYALGQLWKDNVPIGLACCDKIRKDYSDTEFAQVVSRENFYDGCPVCRASGQESKRCDACDGKGLCKACGGKGFKQETKVVRGVNNVTNIPCSVCNKSARCPKCKGLSVLLSPCRNCKGFGRLKVNAKLKIMYDLAVGRTLALLADRVKSGIDLKMKSGAAGAVDDGAVTNKIDGVAAAVAAGAAVSSASNAVPARPATAPSAGK